MTSETIGAPRSGPVSPLPGAGKVRDPANRMQAELRAARRVVRMPRTTIALLLISVALPLVLFALAAMANRRDTEIAANRFVERTTRILHEHA